MRLDSSCYRSSAIALGCWNRVRDFVGALDFHKPLAVDSREARVLRACSAHAPFPLGAACPSAAPPAERPTDGALRLCFAAPENARQWDDGSCSSPDETLRQASAAPGSQRTSALTLPSTPSVGPALRSGLPAPSLPARVLSDALGSRCRGARGTRAQGHWREAVHSSTGRGQSRNGRPRRTRCPQG